MKLQSDTMNSAMPSNSTCITLSTILMALTVVTSMYFHLNLALSLVHQSHIVQVVCINTWILQKVVSLLILLIINEVTVRIIHIGLEVLLTLGLLVSDNGYILISFSEMVNKIVPLHIRFL